MTPTSMWVPPSYEYREAYAVRTAVEDYDPNLSFGQNPRNGQWCIFIKKGTNEVTQEGDFPILGFPAIPEPNQALKRLHNSDARRKGNEIIDAIQRNNDKIHADMEAKASDADGQLAEALDWGFRKMGAHPFPRIFVPGTPDGGSDGSI